MKIFKNFIGLAALALCLGFASCSSDDDAPSYSNVAVSNSELPHLSTFQAQRLIPLP